MVKKIDLSDGDVVRITNVEKNFTAASTLTIAELKHSLVKKFFGQYEDWLNQGVGCQVLFEEMVRGWQSGKVRLVVQFIPDKPDVFAEDSLPVLPPSPLDDLRSNLNIDNQ